ncbi:MAG: AMP-binding protein, partial [Romboutsia sp.]|nr:AMP-binding protein [Romboutsia sp.]
MSKQIEIIPEFNNFREVLANSSTCFKDNIAYKYKKSLQKPIEYVEKTYEQVDKDVKAISEYILSKKDSSTKIALIGNNRYEWVISYFSVVCSGMTIAPMDKMLPENEIESLIKRSEVEIAVFDKKYLDVFKKLKNDSSVNLKTLICMDSIDDPDVLNFENILDEGRKLRENGSKKYEDDIIDDNKMAIMLFTSGTTDMSKIVMLSQKNICNNIHQYQPCFKILPTDTLLSFLPIHHTFESSITIFYGFYSGATIAFCDGLRYIADNLKEYEVSVFVAVPLVLETMYKKIKRGIADQGKTGLINTMVKISNGLLKCHIDVRRKLFKQIVDNFGGKLRIILYGGAALDQDTIVGFKNFGIDSIQGYGLTETSPVLTAERETNHRPGSAGLALDNVELTILHKDKDGIGEIAAKGPNIMLGYYQDEEKTKKAFEDGWFKTGDFGYIDDDGFLFITGRKNDIIVLRNGKNIDPQEVEFLVTNLPYVAETMVYARDASKTDTSLCAKIVYDKETMEKSYPDKSEKDYYDIIWTDIKEIN